MNEIKATEILAIAVVTLTPVTVGRIYFQDIAGNVDSAFAGFNDTVLHCMHNIRLIASTEIRNDTAVGPLNFVLCSITCF